MKSHPDYGDLMLFEDFVNACNCGAFIDYDGHGYLATETQYDNEKVISPSDFYKQSDEVLSQLKDSQFTHILWMNR